MIAVSKAPPAALEQHGQELFAAAVRACGALQAAEKIVRGAGSPKTADIIKAQAEALRAVLQQAAGEAP